MSEESTARNLEEQLQVGKTKVLKGHTNYVLSVFAKDNMIISGSYDKTIKIWDIDTGSCLKTLEGHTYSVRSVYVKDNLIVSGSWDNTIKIWDIDTGTCIKTLTGHTNGGLTVFVKDNLIISGSEDKSIRITPISLFPGELQIFEFVISKYKIITYLEQQILDYFGAPNS
jgi:WD40 repeat protein